MATTKVHLYRSVMDERFFIKIGEYPGDGILDPRWKESSYVDKRGRTRISKADVVIEVGADGPEVNPGGGTSLHGVPHWYSYVDFWIPEGTEYSDADIVIRKDDDLRTSPYNPKLSGYHYQLESKHKVPVSSFQAALNNMARAAVVRQVALSKIKQESKA